MVVLDLKSGINLLRLVNKSEYKWLQPRKLKNEGFDIFNDICKGPTVLCLKSMNGGTSHAITTVGRLVFDANCSRALPLCQETLNYCCSTDEQNSEFYCVYKGYRFEEQGKKGKLDEFMKTYLIYSYTLLL